MPLCVNIIRFNYLLINSMPLRVFFFNHKPILMERKVQNQEELEPSKSTGQKGCPMPCLLQLHNLGHDDLPKY